MDTLVKETQTDRTKMTTTFTFLDIAKTFTISSELETFVL